VRIAQAVRFVAYELHDKTLIVIPTYNERENIVDLLTQIREIIPGAHVVVVRRMAPAMLSAHSAMQTAAPPLC
jgi:CRISPR/Cas system-associated exonuclease Cas4 (RecB family)